MENFVLRLILIMRLRTKLLTIGTTGTVTVLSAILGKLPPVGCQVHIKYIKSWLKHVKILFFFLKNLAVVCRDCLITYYIYVVLSEMLSSRLSASF